MGKVCKSGIKTDSYIKFRFGFKGALQGGGDCQFVTAGYGLEIGSVDYASAAVGKTPPVVKKTFGYLLGWYISVLFSLLIQGYY